VDCTIAILGVGEGISCSKNKQTKQTKQTKQKKTIQKKPKHINRTLARQYEIEVFCIVALTNNGPLGWNPESHS
jgi:hypothetical protein